MNLDPLAQAAGPAASATVAGAPRRVPAELSAFAAQRDARVRPGTLAGDVAKIPIEQLANHPNIGEPAKIAEASRQFEAALLRQILNDARKPVFRSEFSQSSAIGSIYDSLITNQLADSISESGEFGLARSLQRQLDRPGHESADNPAAPPSGPSAGAPKISS